MNGPRQATDNNLLLLSNDDMLFRKRDSWRSLPADDYFNVHPESPVGETKRTRPTKEEKRVMKTMKVGMVKDVHQKKPRSRSLEMVTGKWLVTGVKAAIGKIDTKVKSLIHKSGEKERITTTPGKLTRPDADAGDEKPPSRDWTGATKELFPVHTDFCEPCLLSAPIMPIQRTPPIVPTDTDVLFRDRTSIIEHPGNVAFKLFIEERTNTVEYERLNLEQQSQSNRDLLDEYVRCSKARFLSQDVETGEWHNMYRRKVGRKSVSFKATVDEKEYYVEPPLEESVAEATEAPATPTRQSSLASIDKRSNERFVVRRNKIWVTMKYVKWLIQGGCRGVRLSEDNWQPCPIHAILCELIETKGFTANAYRFEFVFPDPSAMPKEGFDAFSPIAVLKENAEIVELCCSVCAHRQAIQNDNCLA